ncbi:MAG TPA: imidazole glycerol phosphate synthase subunit HisH [Sphingobacteriaceae bacterium]
MITIVDYGAGNIGSIVNMIRKIGVEVEVSSDLLKINTAKKLILPGVGNFDYGMQKLIESGLIESLNNRVLVEKCPILGICLGVQLFTKGSQEGELKGLGWFNAEVVKFQFDGDGKKIPHMGWNEVRLSKGSKLFTGLDDHARFYFVHSYHLRCNEEADCLAKTDYGYAFTAALEKENIVGVQFHPEKSHKFGMKILKNFVELY